MTLPVTRPDAGVCVVIAAYNSGATIARAVASALAQPEVAEVVVVDDASTDDTGDRAHAVDDGTNRLTVLSLPVNAGPSKARNIAIASSNAPLIAILDADDFLLPGRFADLLAVSDWDMIADNIAFVPEGHVDTIDPLAIATRRIAPRTLTAASFVAGCLSRADRYKGELGFLKPVLSRAFLVTHDLSYNEKLRLAEDYDLYVRALMAGARFRVAETCGYVAVDRPGSLSNQHQLADLVNFEQAIGETLAGRVPDADLRRQLSRHYEQTAQRRRHRQLLDRKREVGLLGALREQANAPLKLVGTLTAVASDKLETARRRLQPSWPAERRQVRFLL